MHHRAGITVRTGGGSVAGDDVVDRGTGRSVRRWLGIPYAEPPLGALRWQPPRPARPWAGVRPTTSFGASAPQRTTSPFVQAVPGMEVAATSEDCLTLNVWSPAGAEGLPVLVWIHGGAFVIGGSSLPTYDATHLAALGDVVVVSCNYRLGALGFLCLPDDAGTTPNAGLHDLVAALGWVRDEIAGFGGDPDRVTIVGESAGAGCIRHLLGMPAASGLFRRAILQSPGADTVHRPAAEELGEAFLRHAGVGADGVRSLDVEAVLEAQERAAADLTRKLGAMPWCPVVDGEVVPEPLRLAPVDVIVGTTSEELRPYAKAMARVPAEKETRALRNALAPILGRDCGDEAAAAALAAYRAEGGDPVDGWSALLTDAMMRAPLLDLADDLAGQARIFTYVFEWPAAKVGSAHAVDIPFVFGTFDVDGWGDFVGADDDARRLSDDLVTAWSAFAATGDPTNPRTGAWAAHQPGDRATMVLGRRCGMEDRPTRIRFDARLDAGG
jgi:para-nitrobenzyl esterase